MKNQKLYEEFMSTVSDAVISDLTQIRPVVFVGALSYGTSGPEDDPEFTRLCDRALRDIEDPILDQGYETVFLAVLELALKFVHWVCREAAEKNPARFKDPDEYSVNRLFDAVFGSEFLGNICQYCVFVSHERFGSVEAAEKVFEKIGSKLHEALQASQVKLTARVLLALIVMLAQAVFRQSLAQALSGSSDGQRILAAGFLSKLGGKTGENEDLSGPKGFVKPTKGEA